MQCHSQTDPGVSEPVWKSRSYNRELALKNLSVLSRSISALEETCPVDSNDNTWHLGTILEAVDPVFQHYYGLINYGIDSPFMSAEEIVKYYNLAEALFIRWNAG